MLMRLHHILDWMSMISFNISTSCDWIHAAEYVNSCSSINNILALTYEKVAQANLSGKRLLAHHNINIKFTKYYFN